MKRILLSLLVLTCLVKIGKAQIFSQDFSSSPLITEYVNSSGVANKFTELKGGTENVVSIVNGALRFAKIGGNSAYFSRNANFDGPPSVLKISFTFEVISSTTNQTTQAQFYVGSKFNNNATPPTGTNTHSRLVFNFNNDNAFSMNSSTAPTTETTYYKSKQKITWIINNSGAQISYKTPDGETTKLLNDDKWDVYVGEVSEPVLSNRDGLSNSTVGSGKDNNLENIYFSYPSGSQSNATFQIDDIVIESQETILPIALTSFNAKTNAQDINLTWSTSSEQNNEKFEILRSADGKNFTRIGEVKGAGTKDEVSTYSFTDKAALPSYNYYQLKQVDFNGKSTTSEVVAVKSNILATQLKVYTGKDGSLKLNAYVENAKPATLTVYDLNGSKVITKKINLNAGYNNFSIPFTKTKGMYVARLISETETLSEKFFH